MFSAFFFDYITISWDGNIYQYACPLIIIIIIIVIIIYFGVRMRILHISDSFNLMTFS